MNEAAQFSLLTRMRKPSTWWLVDSTGKANSNRRYLHIVTLPPLTFRAQIAEILSELELSSDVIARFAQEKVYEYSL